MFRKMRLKQQKFPYKKRVFYQVIFIFSEWKYIYKIEIKISVRNIKALLKTFGRILLKKFCGLTDIKW